jgi:SM-20-related protein
MLLAPSDDEIAALGGGGFLMRDGLLGEADALAVAAEASALPGFRPAGVARAATRDRAVRGDELVWVDAEHAPPALARLDATFGAAARELDAAAYLGLGRHELQVARYPGDGARYQRHRDAFVGPESRLLTLIYYANPGWERAHGGELRLHLGDGPVDVEPVLDRLVVFLAAKVWHEVLPARAPRLAVTAWFYGRHPLPTLMHQP